MSVTESEPITVGITVPSIAPQDLLERVTAMADDLAAAGISVELDVIHPRIECAGCKELRDAHNGHVLRPGQA